MGRVEILRAIVFALALALAPSLRAAAQCASDLDCALNGLCAAGACACDAPWSGPNCATLAFAVTPASAHSLYPLSDPRNTWNGPIVAGPDGLLHIYVPYYPEGSLGAPTTVKHGVAAAVTGPWDWASRPDVTAAVGENPAAVVFPDPQSGDPVYSLWIAGLVLTAASPDGPFAAVANFSYPGGNPAPIFHAARGAFFMTNQATDTVWTAPRVAPGAQWSVFAEISHDALPQNQYHVEDPL